MNSTIEKVRIHNETIECWQEGEWNFRAKECSDGKWHVWCSKDKLQAKNALLERVETILYFEFAPTKEEAIFDTPPIG